MFQDLPSYAGVKSSAFWQARVPESWQEVPGLAVVKENRHKNADLAEKQVLSLSFGNVVVKPVEMQRGLVPESYESYQVLEPGDIVIRPTDLQNDQRSIRVGFVKERGIITSAYIGLRATGDWEPEYAYLYLSVVDSSKRIYGMGSGLRQQLGWADIKRMPCLVPSRDEQAAIVKYLAHANARINKAITAKRRLIALLREEEAAVRTNLFAELGTVTQRAKDVCLRIIDCKNRTPEFVEGGAFFVVRTTCVRGGKFSFDGGYTTDLANFTEWTRRGAPRAGDVLFTREAPAGEAALVPEDLDVCLGQRMMLYRPDSTKILPEFLLQAIYDEPARRFINLATNGSTVGHLRVGDVGSVPVRVPSLPAQQELVAKLDSVGSRVSKAVGRVEREIALLQEFRTRLVADVVTGQVDVRGVAATLPDAAEAIADAVEEDVPVLDEELVDAVEGDDV